MCLRLSRCVYRQKKGCPLSDIPFLILLSIISYRKVPCCASCTIFELGRIRISTRRFKARPQECGVIGNRVQRNFLPS